MKGTGSKTEIEICNLYGRNLKKKRNNEEEENIEKAEMKDKQDGRTQKRKRSSVKCISNR